MGDIMQKSILMRIKPSYGKFNWILGKAKNGVIVATVLCRDWREVNRFKRQWGLE